MKIVGGWPRGALPQKTPQNQENPKESLRKTNKNHRILIKTREGGEQERRRRGEEERRRRGEEEKKGEGEEEKGRRRGEGEGGEEQRTSPPPPLAPLVHSGTREVSQSAH